MTGPGRSGAGGAADRVSSSGAAASGRTSSSADAFERSVRRWMNAYPRRWRVMFGDDLVATALELADPGQRRLGLREGLALVRGGWALRRRERPPLRVRMLTGFGRVSARDRAAHRAWIVDIALSPWLRLPAQLVIYMPIVLVNLYMWWDRGLLLNLVAAVGLPLSALGPCLVPAWGRRVSRATWRTLFPDEPVPPLLERPARSPSGQG